tara:strand:+ start:319 stop:789 length:471 start_codon:yes stop_codon:yes gene_type:complete
MSNYYCYICQSLIKGTIYKAYDQNLCNPSCREYLIKNFNFNSNYTIEKKEYKPIKKSISCIKIYNEINEINEIDTQEPFRNDEITQDPFRNDEIESPSINLFELFNLSSIISKEEINKIPTYEKHERKMCFYLYSISYSDLTLKNVFEKTKNILIY